MRTDPAATHESPKKELEPGVVASLWSVDDRAARRFAKELFRLWTETRPGQPGRTPAEAHREAMMKRRAARRDPGSVRATFRLPP